MKPAENEEWANQPTPEPGVMVDGEKITLKDLMSMRDAEKRLGKFAFVVDRLRLDALVGFLFPEVGDMATATLALYPVIEAVLAGVPRGVVVRMLINIGADLGIGLIPIAGDAVDAFFHANIKNHKLFAEHLAQIEKKFAEHPGQFREAREKGAVGLTRASVSEVLKKS